MDSRSFTFPKGEYFFGDLSYLFLNSIRNEEWSNIFCVNGEGDWDYKDKEYLLFNTGGDGYFSNHRRGFESVPVDSGSLGLIPTEVVDSEILDKAEGIIFNAEHELKIDVQGEAGRTVGFHIYQKRERYFFDDQAILIVIDKDEIDESYFTSKCPKFSEDYEDYVLFHFDEDDDLTETERDDLNKKILQLTKEIIMNPNDISSFYKRGVARRDLGEEEYYKDMEKAQDMKADSAIDYFYRSEAKSNYSCNWSGSLNDLTKAISIDPNYFEAYFHRAIQRNLGIGSDDYIGAKDDYSKCIELDPNNGHIYKLRGELKMKRLDDIKGACEDWKKAAELGDEGAAKLLEEHCE